MLPLPYAAQLAVNQARRDVADADVAGALRAKTVALRARQRAVLNRSRRLTVAQAKRHFAMLQALYG